MDPQADLASLPAERDKKASAPTQAEPPKQTEPSSPKRTEPSSPKQAEPSAPKQTVPSAPKQAEPSRKMKTESGFVVVDKAQGWTSHDVVAKARGVFGTRKIGHSGTLDPMATGVLVLGVNKGTRLLRFLTDLPKTYVAHAVLGQATDSLDADGAITETQTPKATIQQIIEAASGFVGEIEQVPPMVSAIKIDGKRLHELAREGKTVERKARRVRIYDLKVSPEFVQDNVFEFEVTCSSGTYVRTLAADIAASIGELAHLCSLQRTAIGSHRIDSASPLETAKPISLLEGLADYSHIEIDDHDAQRVRMGQPLKPELFQTQTQSEQHSPNGPWVLKDQAGELVAVFELKGDKPRSSVVIPS